MRPGAHEESFDRRLGLKVWGFFIGLSESWLYNATSKPIHDGSLQGSTLINLKYFYTSCCCVRSTLGCTCISVSLHPK